MKHAEQSIKRNVGLLALATIWTLTAYAQEFDPDPGVPQPLAPCVLADGSITQSADCTIVPSTGVACRFGEVTSNSKYFRRFFLGPDHGVTSNFVVESVDFGIESFIPAPVPFNRFYVQTFAIPIGEELRELPITDVLDTVDVESGPVDTTLVNVAIGGEVDPTTHDLVVEIGSLDFEGLGFGVGQFIPGANSNGQTRPSYIAAFDCGVIEPIDLATLGFPDSHIVMVVNGREDRWEKVLTSGPDRDGDGEIDIVVPINVEEPTAYDFTITDPGDTPVWIYDRVPAEWDVSHIEFDDTSDDDAVLPLGCGEDTKFTGDYGEVEIGRGGKSGKKCNSDTSFRWMPSLEGPTVLYGAAHSGPVGDSSRLYTIDPSTGAASPLDFPTGFERVGGLDFGPDGKLYGIGQRFSDGQLVLITIDTTTGLGTEVGPTETNDFILLFDISFRNGDGQLFGTGFGFNIGCTGLATVDTATANTIAVGPISTCGPGNGIAFSATDVLYFVEGASGGTLYSLDQSTGTETPIGPLSYVGFPALSRPRINAMEADPDTGVFYASVNDGSGGSGPNYLGVLDPATGVVTNVGLSVNGLDALAFAPGKRDDDLNIHAVARCHTNRNNQRCLPTSCGALYLNHGAVALLKDPFTDESVFEDGEPVLVDGPTNPICLAAVDDINGDGSFAWDGTGDEDGDALPDYVEACELGTDPCLADTDGDGIPDNEDICPLDELNGCN